MRRRARGRRSGQGAEPLARPARRRSRRGRAARRRRRRRRPSPGRWSARRSRGSLTPASANMPGVGDEAGEHGRDADARRRAGPRAAERRTRAGRTSSPSRRVAPPDAALPASEETNTMWPGARARHGAEQQPGERIGARRLTSSARSTCSPVKSSASPLAGSAALATSTSTGAGVLGQPRHGGAVGEVAGQRRARRVSAASGSSTSAPAPGEDQRARPRAANARAIAWPSPPVAPVTSTRPPMSSEPDTVLSAGRSRPSR